MGTVGLTTPGPNDDWHQYVSAQHAIKVTTGPSGAYTQYWGFDGVTALRMTIHDDRTFSLPTSSNISFFHVPIADPPLTQYSGVYHTNTQWYGGFFSPLLINDDGTISFGETTIPANALTYNSTTATVSFDWVRYKDTSFKAFFSINGVGSHNTTLSGTLWPRPQDGGVSFSGSVAIFFAKPSFTSIRAFDGFFKDGDTIELGTQPSHKPMRLDDQRRLVEAQLQTDRATQFRVTFDDSFTGFALKDSENHWLTLAADGSNKLVCSGTLETAVVFHLYLCMDGDVIIGSGDKRVPAQNSFMTTGTDHFIKMLSARHLTSTQEYGVSFTTRRLAGLAAARADAALLTETSNHCDDVNIKFLVHLTVGMLPLAGQGVSMDAVALGFFKAVGLEFLKLIAPALMTFKEILARTDYVEASMVILFGGVLNLMYQIYELAPDLPYKFLRLAWEKAIISVDPLKASMLLANLIFCRSADAFVLDMLKLGNVASWTKTLVDMAPEVAKCIGDPYPRPDLRVGS